MILKTEFEKIAYLKSCQRHIDRIKKSMATSSEHISSDKIKVLSKIYEKVSKENLNVNSINLKEIYKNIKREISTERSVQYPTDILMKTQRGWVFRTFLGYILNLIWPMPKSAAFLNKTGFFDVTEENEIIYAGDNINAHVDENLSNGNSLEHDIEEERKNKVSKEPAPQQTESVESKETKAANHIAHSYLFYRHMKTAPLLKIEQYPIDLIPKYRNKKIINDEQYERYVELFDKSEEKRALRLVKNYISRITFDRFLKQLECCMNELDKYMIFNPVKKTPILLINDKGHSQEWVNNLAQPRLKHSYGSQIQTIDITHPPNFDAAYVTRYIFNELAKHGTATHLYIDDCSYSGTQLCTYLSRVLIQMSIFRSLCSGTINFIFVLPYMTKKAANALQELFTNYKKLVGANLKMNFKLINTGIIPPIKDLPINEEDKTIFLKAVDTSETKALTLTDWKIPDYMSFPHFFASGSLPYRTNGNHRTACFLPQDPDFKPYKENITF